jgi:hypothetical protein
MKQQIQARAYAAFVQVLNGKRETFDLSQVWAELPETTRAHFDHASNILLSIDEAINLIEESFEEPEEQPTEPEPAADPDSDEQGAG